MIYNNESHIKSVEDVKTFFHHLVDERKVNFHPDDERQYCNPDDRRLLSFNGKRRTRNQIRRAFFAQRYSDFLRAVRFGLFFNIGKRPLSRRIRNTEQIASPFYARASGAGTYREQFHKHYRYNPKKRVRNRINDKTNQ